MAENDGWGRRDGGDTPGAGDADDSTREFRPAPGGAGPAWNQPGGGQPDWGQPPPQPPYPQPMQPEPHYPDPGKSDGGRMFLLIAVPLLAVLLVLVVLMWQWDNLFGSDDSQGSAAPGTTATQQPTAEPDDGEADETPGEPSTTARPEVAGVPSNAEPVNAAARNGDPAGNFNNIYKSPPIGDNYTTDGFAEAVRNAFVDAYLEDRETDHVLNVVSPSTNASIEMTCEDQGSYIHCSGGNDANVYIA